MIISTYIANTIRKEGMLVFLFSLAVIFGNAYLILVNHDANFSSDEKSYLLMAEGNFDVSITHRYRVIIPFLARGIALFINALFGVFHIQPLGNGLPLGFAFLVINALLMAGAGLVIYKIARLANASKLVCFFALMAIISSGYCSYITGLALTDSLYFFCVTLLFYAIISKNQAALIFCLLIGPLAKESFWLFLPFVLLFGRFMPFWKLLLMLAIGAGIFLAENEIIDLVYGGPATQRTAGAIGHLDNSLVAFRNIFTLKGLLSIFSVFGLFNFILLLGIFCKPGSLKLQKGWIPVCIVFLAIVLLHMLLSGDLARMWFLASPVFALAIVFNTEKLLLQLKSYQPL